MINNKLLYLIEGVNEYTERRSIRILMNSRLRDFFFLSNKFKRWVLLSLYF